MKSNSYRKFFSLQSLSVIFFALLMLSHAKTTLDNFKKEGGLFPSANLLRSDNAVVEFPSDGDRSWAALFWSVHCGPCRVEMELIQKSINSGYVPADRIFAIHICGDIDSVSSHMTKHGFTFPFLIDARGELAAQLDVELTPTSFHVEKNRNIRWVSSGLGVTHVFRLANHLK